MTESFRLDEIRVDPDAGTLESAGNVQRLPPQLMTLLCLLAKSGQTTVNRDDLIQALWPRGFINEDALSRAVAELRRHLGDDARSPRFIETVPKRGYRLMVAAEPLEDGHETKDRQAANPRVGYWVVAAMLLTVGVIYWFLNTPKHSVIPDLLATATQLSADPVMKHHPQLSPDGKFLAYAQWRDDHSALILLPTDHPTQALELDTADSAWSPAFAPDSNRIAVALTVESGCTVHLWSVSGENLQPLVPCVLPNESAILDWSADDQFLAYVDTDPATGTSAIWQVSLVDGSRTKLTSPPDGYSFDTRPRYSPDGRWLSFSRGTRAAREIWVLDLQQRQAEGKMTAEPRQLSFDHQFTISHQWMSDSRTLVLDSERSGYRALWTLNLDGEWNLLGARDAESPSLAGNQLAFKVSQYESNIWALNAATGEPSDKPLIASNRYDSNPAWSPDGREIAFSSNRTGRGAIWVAAADGSSERLVYEPETGRVVAPAWSPDGSFLIATQYQTGGQNLVRIALDREEVSIIPTTGNRPYSGIYSPDGAWLYYIAKAGIEGNRLWRQPTDESAPGEVVIQQPVNTFQLAPGPGIYYTKYAEHGLYRSSIDEPETETLIRDDLVVSNWGDWTISGRWIFYLGDGPDGKTHLFRIPLEGGEKHLVSDFYPTSMWPNLAVNAQTGVILVARTDRAQSDLFLVELDP